MVPFDATLKRMEVTGGPDEQAIALRDAMRVLFPEAVALDFRVMAPVSRPEAIGE